MKYSVLVTGSYDEEDRPSTSFSLEVNGMPALKAGIKSEIMREMSRVKATAFNGKVTATRVQETTVYDEAPLSFSIAPQIVIVVDL